MYGSGAGAGLIITHGTDPDFPDAGHAIEIYLHTPAGWAALEAECDKYMNDGYGAEIDVGEVQGPDSSYTISVLYHGAFDWLIGGAFR